MKDMEEAALFRLSRWNTLRLVQQDRLVDNVDAGSRRPLDERSRRQVSVCARVEGGRRGRRYRRVIGKDGGVPLLGLGADANEMEMKLLHATEEWARRVQFN